MVVGEHIWVGHSDKELVSSFDLVGSCADRHTKNRVIVWAHGESPDVGSVLATSVSNGCDGYLALDPVDSISTTLVRLVAFPGVCGYLIIVRR